MFNAKRIDSGKIYQVLDVIFNDTFHTTHFLIWDNNGWRWRPADKFVPPNVNPEDVAPINVRTQINEDNSK